MPALQHMPLTYGASDTESDDDSQAGTEFPTSSNSAVVSILSPSGSANTSLLSVPSLPASKADVDGDGGTSGGIGDSNYDDYDSDDSLIDLTQPGSPHDEAEAGDRGLTQVQRATCDLDMTSTSPPRTPVGSSTARASELGAPEVWTIPDSE